MNTNLPRIDHWLEWIDDGSSATEWTFAAFAQRCWDHAPRYSVFLIVTCDPQQRRQAIQSAFLALDIELDRFERALLGYYGRGFAKRWAAEAESGHPIIGWKNGDLYPY